ncbi:MAG: polyprenyl synthetase family protein [Planctomycetales bacterium]|nr:polyprenyl synthetase family protein [Planctomycetales bacterium]
MEVPQLLIDLTELRQAIDGALENYTRDATGAPQRLVGAMRYSVLAPGKRLRPLLTLLASQAISGNWDAAIPAACAIEFIHVYSLIHDDLPSMDDDDLRRGQPTCHRQYDEATAILAGDSLQMLAIEVLCKAYDCELAAKCCEIVAVSAGRQWLVGGQADDLAAEGRYGQVEIANELRFDYLKSIHRRKTGAIIEASLRLGGVVASASEAQIQHLCEYGQALGLAFQITDDCLDVDGTVEQLGKQTRKDSTHGKLTYPRVLGLEGSRQLVSELIANACQAVSSFGETAAGLVQIARFVEQRRS